MPLTYDGQRLLAVAVVICFGPSMLREPSIVRTLQYPGLGCVAPSLLLCPLLVGAASQLPEEEVAAILMEAASAGGDTSGRVEASSAGGNVVSHMRGMRALLLSWAIGAALEDQAGGMSGLSEAGGQARLTGEAGPALSVEAEGVREETSSVEVLMAAFRQVKQPGRAVEAVAACLALAQRGRVVGDERVSAEASVVGCMMRLVGAAMVVEEGEGGFAALASAVKTAVMDGSGDC